MLKATGTIVFNDFEGGFWGIEGDDGKKYCPVELPIEFQIEGLKVRVEMKRAAVMSFQMWGIHVEITEISLCRG